MAKTPPEIPPGITRDLVADIVQNARYGGIVDAELKAVRAAFDQAIMELHVISGRDEEFRAVEADLLEASRTFQELWNRHRARQRRYYPDR